MTTIGYRPSTAQKLYQQNKNRCGQHYRLANAKVKTLVGHLFLDLQCSPEGIFKRLIYENSAIHISYNTIYRAIYRGVFNDNGLSHGSRGAIRKLRRRGKSRYTKTYGERRGQVTIPHMIHERPLEAHQRSEIDHWEACYNELIEKD